MKEINNKKSQLKSKSISLRISEQPTAMTLNDTADFIFKDTEVNKGMSRIMSNIICSTDDHSESSTNQATPTQSSLNKYGRGFSKIGSTPSNKILKKN